MPDLVRRRKKTRSSDEPTLAASGAEREQVMRALMSVLRVARQESDLTQREMGDHLGYSEDVISNMEALRTAISFADAVLWARRSRLDDAELFEQCLFALRKRRQRDFG